MGLKVLPMVLVASLWSNVMLVTKDVMVLVCAVGKVEMSAERVGVGMWVWVMECGYMQVSVSGWESDYI